MFVWMPETESNGQSRDRYSRYFFRPIVFIGVGGIAAEVLYVLRAYLWMALGFLPECVRWLVIDFYTDSPKPPAHFFADEIPFSVWQQVCYHPPELSLLKTDIDCVKLAERMRSGEEDVGWLCQIVPPEVVARYSGAEACQIPALL